MRPRTCGALLAAALIAVGGCESSGISTRETPGHDYVGDLASLTADSSPPGKPRPVNLPMKLAVAQVGEVAPPQRMLDQLQKNEAFRLVSPVPCVKQDMNQLRRFAQSVGADYLFVFGGTIDRNAGDTGLSVANLTIIGAYVIPSKQLDAEGKAAGALIDLADNRVVASVSADTQSHDLVPAAASDSSGVHQMESMRDKLTDDLASHLSARVKELPAAL